MTIDVAKLRQLHRPYQPVPPYGELYCQGCYLDWPCATSELLDAYEERDRLREALALAVSMVRGGEDFHATGCEGCDGIKRALEGRE